MDIITVGIDASLTSTGLICLKGDEITRCETFPNESKLNMVDRVGKIIWRIKQSIVLHYKRYPKNKIFVALEGFSFGSRGRSVFDIGYLGWRIREQLMNLEDEYGINWILVPPSSLKKYATGKGNCKKELVIMNIYKRWDIEFDDNNQADAFVLAKIAQSYFLDEKDIPKFQIEALDGVKGANKK